MLALASEAIACDFDDGRGTCCGRLSYSRAVCSLFAASRVRRRARTVRGGRTRSGARATAGGSNWITPDKVLKAVALVKTGRMIELGHVYERGMPLIGNRSYNIFIPSFPTHGPFLDNKHGVQRRIRRRRKSVRSARSSTARARRPAGEDGRRHRDRTFSTTA